MTKEEKARFDAAVQEAAAKMLAQTLAEQQKLASQAMESAVKNALKGVDNANLELQKAQKAVAKELAAAEKARAKAEKEGEKMANTYFANKQKEFMEAARTELLRQLTRMHVDAGKKPREIAQWLNVPLAFVENIRELAERVAKLHPPKPPRTQLEGNPRLRYENKGRGGTIWFENYDTRFDMWWEFAGGDALVILAIPSAAEWEAATQLPLAERTATLNFIGETIVKDQISGNGSFIVGEQVITFYGG